MTKRELIERLEPFSDEIEIITINHAGYAFNLRSYYSTFYGNEGKIILVTGPLDKVNSVELIK